MIAWIAGPALAIYVLVLGATAVSQYRQSKQEVERAMTRLAVSYSARLDGYLREASRIAETAARVMETGVAFTDDEVYALTAWLLHLNDIVPADAVMDARSLARVQMPNRDGFIDEYGR